MSDKALRERIEALREKMSPPVVKANLLAASLFLTAFEMLKAVLVDSLKGFTSIDGAYETEVLGLHKKKFAASCLWYLKQGVLTQHQVDDLHAIREHRDKIAHELPNLLFDPKAKISLDLLLRSRTCMQVLAKFWFSIHASTDPQFDGQDLDRVEVDPASVAVFDYLISITAEAVRAGVSQATENGTADSAGDTLS